jgi:glycerol-3-phosphate cytidylyltransferase
MKIGFTCGVFDLFHAGHVLMLKECKEHCERLVIGLNRCVVLGENKNKPIYTFEQRKIILESNIYVDEVIGYSNENDLTKIMINRKFDVRFLGDDYKSKPITSPEIIKSIIFCNRGHGYSSSSVRKKIINGK